MSAAAPEADMIDLAADWLRSTSRADRGGPAVPQLARRFGLKPADAVKAIRLAGNCKTPERSGASVPYAARDLNEAARNERTQVQHGFARPLTL